MKKNIILNIAVILLLFSSCKKDFLNRQPQDAYSNSSLWTSASDANAALTGVDNGQYNPGTPNNYSDDGNGWATATWIVYFDTMSDNAYSQYPWEGFQAYGNGSVNPTQLVMPRPMEQLYLRTARCNFFLANIDKTPMDAPLERQTK